jgi:hypothetical protein
MKKENNRTVLIVGCFLALMFLIMGAFIVGTLSGFNAALRSLDSCEPVDCAVLGIGNDSIHVCEVCSDIGVGLIKDGG